MKDLEYTESKEHQETYVKLDKIKDVYNERQHQFVIIAFLDEEENTVLIHELIKPDFEIRTRISFYEWLFSPKYKVFEVFEVFGIRVYVCLFNDEANVPFAKVKSPEQIIDYIFSTFHNPMPKAKKILKYHSEGYTAKQIIQKGKGKFCQSYVYRLVSSYEKKSKPCERKNQVLNLFKKGTSIHDICNHTKLKPRRVYEIIKT